MAIMDMFANLESTGQQVAQFITESTARINAIHQRQEEIIVKLAELAEGHAKLHDQQAEILGWIAEIDDSEAEEALETVEEAAETIAEASEQIAEKAAEIVEETMTEETEVAQSPEVPEEVTPHVAEEVKEEVKEETLPEPRKEDDKLIETEIPPATETPKKRKRTFIRI
jgi:uncharacterized phage infection (PIP) family protein YhgE